MWDQRHPNNDRFGRSSQLVEGDAFGFDKDLAVLLAEEPSMLARVDATVAFPSPPFGGAIQIRTEHSRLVHDRSLGLFLSSTRENDLRTHSFFTLQPHHALVWSYRFFSYFAYPRLWSFWSLQGPRNIDCITFFGIAPQDPWRLKNAPLNI
jgi:hypothetical protein